MIPDPISTPTNEVNSPTDGGIGRFLGANFMPLLGTAASVTGGLIDYFGAKKKIPGLKDQLASAQQSYLGSIDDIAKNQYRKTSEQKDLEALMTGSKSPGANIDPIQTIQANQLGAYGQGGERALMLGSQNLAGNTYNMAQQDLANRFGRELAGRQTAATTAQDIADRNVGVQTAADQLKAGFYGQQADIAQQNLAGTQSRMESAIPGAVGNLLSFTGMMEAKNGLKVKYESGGLIEEILRNKDIYKTGGEFNHDTNKKALIDEESGEKEAELTGGEYVLNPEQGEEIHAQYEAIEAKVENGEPVSEEEWMMFYEAVKNVFSQPQFNEEVA